MNKRLRSIAKMQWVWLALQDSRYKTRFWGWFSGMDNKLNFWWDQNVRTCAEDLFPLLRWCSFCKTAMVSGNRCVFDDIKDSENNCIVIGRKLLQWLEGGCK